MKVSEKIEFIAKKECSSVRSFELMIGKSNGYLSMMKRKDSSPSVDVLSIIVEKFPKYNLYWVMGLSDEMYAENINKDAVKEPDPEYRKEIANIDFVGLSKRVDIVIEQNNKILDKLSKE